MQQNSHQGCIYKWQIAEAELEGAAESALCDSCGWLGMDGVGSATKALDTSRKKMAETE